MTDTKHHLDTPWHGGDAPPSNWDGDTTTLVYLGGTNTYYSSNLWNYARNGRCSPYDIVQYRRKPDALPELTWGYDRADELADNVLGSWVEPVRLRAAFARYIEAHEPAPGDPDEALADRVVRQWCRQIGWMRAPEHEDLALRAIKAAREILK